ncbi:hypothetical protein ACEUZ9_001097 [Paracoccus litorisediminis]|uniref:hypothetical protein n=1 Tax=Paracoccus litorisediminis TaxID=2006130 RepID=UPI0037308F27
MITDRITPRQTVKTWLDQLAAGARAEKASTTQETIVEMSSALLSMVTSSHTVDPAKMRELIEGGDFVKRALTYFAKNWVLVSGIAGERNPVLIARQGEEAKLAAHIALLTMVTQASDLDQISGPALVDLTESAGSDLSRRPDQGNPWPADAIAILLREVLGLPGDAQPAREVDDPAVLLNAARALVTLGARLPVPLLEDKREAAIAQEEDEFSHLQPT